jgi:glycosyl transferase family 25
MDKIEQIVYINLDHRTDRRESIEQTLSFLPSNKIQRFSAIREEKGSIGCTKSHIAVLEMAIQEKWKNIFIVEDDMVWFNNFTDKLSLLTRKLEESYDVIVLAGGTPSYNSQTLKLYKCHCTGAYIVHCNYYETLLRNFKEGLAKLEQTYGKTESNNIDMYWQRLQEKDNWFLIQMLYNPPGFSDIKQRTMDYDIDFGRKKPRQKIGFIWK